MARILTTVALVAVMLSFSALLAEGKKKKNDVPLAKAKTPPPASAEIPQYVSVDDAKSIPDPQANKRDRDYLQCTACMTATDEISARFAKVRQEFQYEPEKIKGYHILASVDEMCPVEAMHYGMLRDDRTKVVHPKYVNENERDKNGLRTQASTIKGGWATKLWTTHCEELLERIEDDIIPLFHGKKLELCPFCKPLREAEEKAKAKEEAKKKKHDEETAARAEAQKAASVESAAGVAEDAAKADL